MKPRSSSSSINSALLVLLLCCSCSSVAKSQTADSCSSGLDAAVGHLIPFDTSNLTCFNAWTSQGFILRYGRSGQDTWRFVLSAPHAGGYVAVGFSSDGAMVGSSAVAGWTTTAGGVGVAKQYRLGGTSSSSCPPDQGSLALVPNTTLLAARSSRLYLAFQFTAAHRPAPYLIFAVGPTGSNNYLARHRSYASAAVDYATGVASISGGASSFNAKKWHGGMAGIGWGVFMPVGVALARYFRRRDPFWFYAHVSVQGVGFVLGAAGVAAGFRLDDDVPGGETHKALGVAVLVFGCLQVAAFLARPGKEAKVRRYWNWYHHYVGRAAVACAAANVFVGLSVAHEGAAAAVFYGVFLAVWVVASVVLEVRLWRSAA